MAELNLEAVIKSGVEKALNKPIVDGKSITEWAAIGMKAPRWVSVQDRLPEVGKNVLVFAKGNETELFGSESAVAICRMSDETYYGSEPTKHEPRWRSAVQFFLTEHTVTHWMPLPEPPEEVTEDETD